jgi:hypothetical protein
MLHHSRPASKVKVAQHFAYIGAKVAQHPHPATRQVWVGGCVALLISSRCIEYLEDLLGTEGWVAKSKGVRDSGQGSGTRQVGHVCVKWTQAN